MLKVMTIVGTRPEIIRLSRVMDKLDKYTNHITVHTGQNYDYELNEIFYKDLEIRKPDHFLNASGENATQTIGKILIAIDILLAKVEPDAVLILGDTNSALAAIAAKRRKIPIFHMEAGNRCFDMRVPEEINRRIVDHTADINLTYSTIARDYLLREGLSPDLVIKTGSPMNEVLKYYLPKILKSNILDELKLEKLKYFIVSMHREENINSEINFRKMVLILNNLALKYQMPVIVSTHPRTQKKIDEFGIQFNPLVKLVKPLGFFDYNFLQINAKTVLSDSGTINEESSIMNFPALNMREAFERPEAMEEASVMLVGLNNERVFEALSILENQERGEKRQLNIVNDYRIDNVSEKVIRIVHSYTDYIKRVIWKDYGG